MPTINGRQIRNNTVQKEDIDTTTTGKALITKIVPGSNVSLSSTGVDAGTGDVTINFSPTAPIIGGTFTGTQDGTNAVFTLSSSLGQEAVYCRGFRLKKDTDYTRSGATITITNTDFIPLSTDALLYDLFF